MTTQAHLSRAYVVHLRHQHRELDRLALDAEQYMGAHWTRSGRTGAADKGAAIERLVALRDQLQRHCDQEIEGGCLEDAACGSPDLAHAAMELERQTRALVRDLTALIRDAQSGRFDFEVGKARFSEIADRLRHYQLEENRLVGQAYGLEVVDGQIVD